MPVPPELLEAYRRTEYRVEYGDEPFAMLIDRHCEPLARCQAAFGVRCSTFITAYNPHSTPTAADVNAAALARLLEDVEARRFDVLHGVGIDPRGAWPGEPSLLVLGLDVPAAVELARSYGQHAVVCAGPDAIPRLVLT